MKGKIFFILVVMFGLNGTINAQEEAVASSSNWTKSAVFQLNFNQTSLNNWAAGGQSSVALSGFSDLNANYAKDDITWTNQLLLGYGVTKLGSNNLIKSDDNIEFSSKLGKKMNDNWNYAAQLKFKTQFVEGYNYPNDSVVISNFLAPGYSLLTLGLEYKPSDNFSLLLSPLTGKFTIVNDQNLADVGAFGVDAAEYDALGNKTKNGANFRAEIGGYIRMKYKKDIMKNVNYSTNLELFSNYIHNPQNIDVNWENIVAMKVNDFLSVNISTQLIYDDDILLAIDSNDDGIKDKMGKRVQFKEVLAIGLTYKL